MIFERGLPAGLSHAGLRIKMEMIYGTTNPAKLHLMKDYLSGTGIQIIGLNELPELPGEPGEYGKRQREGGILLPDSEASGLFLRQRTFHRRSFRGRAAGSLCEKAERESSDRS